MTTGARLLNQGVDPVSDAPSGSRPQLAAALEFAVEQGLIKPQHRTQRVSARVDPDLLDAAMTKSGASSVSELIELALAQIAAMDDFGARLVARAGTVDPDLDLEF